jgi:hypothetical protein
VHSELAKWRDAFRPDVRIGSFRDDHRNEIDLVLETASEVVLVEVKSGQTIQPEWARALQRAARYFSSGDGRRVHFVVVHAGDRQATLDGGSFVPWNGIAAAMSGLVHA